MEKHAKKKLRHGACQKGEDKRWRRSDMEKVKREKISNGEDQTWRKSEERRCKCEKR